MIDASTTLSQSGGNDLAALQNVFQGANVPQEPAFEMPRTLLRQIMTDLKMKRVRLLQSDNLCDLDASGNLGSVTITGTDANGGFTFSPAVPGSSSSSGGCDLLDWALLWALDNSLSPNVLSPHVAVAAFMPPSFVSSGPASTWSPTTLNRYKTYAEKLVRHIVTRSFDAGAPSVIFEVSNEMDIVDSRPLNYNESNPDPSIFQYKPLGPWGRFLWWIDPTNNLHGQVGQPDSYPFEFDLRRLEHGISPVQKIYADVINSVRNDPVIRAQYPEKSIKICGPAFASSSLNHYPLLDPPTMEERFLDQILNPVTLGGQFNSPLDCFSFHYYGDFKNGFGWSPGSGPYTTLAYLTTTVQSKLTALGYGNIPLFLSEWGPYYIASEFSYNHAGAAWAAAFLTEAVANKVTMGSYLLLADADGDAANGNKDIHSLTHKLTDDTGTMHYYPKPPANVFKMFAKMTGTRRPVILTPTGASSNLGAFAASDTDSAHVVVFNYDSQMFTRFPDGSAPGTLPVAMDTPENFTVQLDNLPFNGSVKVRRYLVDANTSNLKNFLVDPTSSPHLQMVEEFDAILTNGQLVLPSKSLGLGVTYWRVTQ